MPQHTSDLRNITEGDSITLETSTGRRFSEIECVERLTEHADPRSGEVRQSQIWRFTVGNSVLIVSILDGLRSSVSDPEFPVHKEASLAELPADSHSAYETVGYLETVEMTQTPS